MRERNRVPSTLKTAEFERMQHNVQDLHDRICELRLRVTATHARDDRTDAAGAAAAAAAAVALTEREIAILRMVADGSDNAEIAAALHFGLGTIKLHVREILEKFGTSTRTEAAVRGVRQGLI